MTKTKKIDVSKMTQIQKKKKAVEWLLSESNTQKHVSKALFKKVGKKFGLDATQVNTAYVNFLNFGVVDLRRKTYSSVKPCKKFNFANNKTSKFNRASCFYKKEITSEEFGNLLHEYLFNYDGRLSDFLLEKEFSSNQWYKTLKEFYISGKLMGRKILDFTKYKKLNVKALLAFTHNTHKTGCYKYNIKNVKKYKDIYESKTTLAQYTKAMHVLDLYL